MTRRPSEEIRSLLERLASSYDRKAWQGPNLRASLRTLSAEEAAWRPGKGRHNIWELVVHCAYWKYAVRRQLTGEKRGSFPAEGSNWFKRPLVMTKEAWHEDLRLLDFEHRALVEAVRSYSPSALHRKPKGSKYPALFLIDGVASHDIYHTGQIRTLKRLMQDENP
jgi:uncharacterized damage-inducible protein DinB